MGIIIEFLAELVIEGIFCFPFYDKAPKWARVIVFIFNSMVLFGIGLLITKLLIERIQWVSIILISMALYGFAMYIRSFLKSLNKVVNPKGER